MTLSIRLLPAGIIDMIPSLPVSTSILIPLVAGLFLAALVLRAQRLPAQPLPGNGLTARQARVARRRVQRSRKLRGVRTANKGTQMTQKQDARPSRAQTSAESAGVKTGSTHSAAPTSGFRIYWGRTAVALLGLLALLGGAATAIAVPFVTSLTWLVPAVCAAVLAVSLVSLQVMAAVRRRNRRRRRVEEAMQEAMSSRTETDEDLAQRQRSATAAAARLGIAEDSSAGVTSAQRTRQQPFDAMSSDSAGKGGPDSLLSVDADGLPTDAHRLFSDSGAESEAMKVSLGQEVLFDQSSAESWEPREVPSAKYMVAEKADRPEPEPIQTQSPAPEGEVKLKASAASPHSPETSASAAQQSIDLDHVLRRRRA